MQKRPVLHLPPTARETGIQITTVIVLILAWVMAAQYYRDLPDTIATHFNFSGQVDGYGSKKTIFIMPAVATIIAVALALLSRIPHQFNYLATITEANAESQYRGGRMMLFVIGLLVALLAVWAVWGMAKG